MSKYKKAKHLQQKMVVEGLIQGKTAKQSMLDAGYSKNYASQPSKLAVQKTFQELMSEYIPQDFVLDAHRKLYTEHRDLKQIRIDSIDDEVINKAIEGYENAQVIKNEEEGYSVILVNEVDKDARRYAIDMSYKVSGAYSPVKVEVKRTYEDLTDKEILEMMKGESK